MSLEESRAVASSPLRRSPASTLRQTWSRPERAASAEISVGFTGWTPESSAVAVDHLRGHLGEQAALDGVGAGGEDRPGVLNVPQSVAAGTLERPGLGDGGQDGLDVGVGRARPAEDLRQLRPGLEGVDERQA